MVPCPTAHSPLTATPGDARASRAARPPSARRHGVRVSHACGENGGRSAGAGGPPHGGRRVSFKGEVFYKVLIILKFFLPASTASPQSLMPPSAWPRRAREPPPTAARPARVLGENLPVARARDAAMPPTGAPIPGETPSRAARGSPVVSAGLPGTSPPRRAACYRDASRLPPRLCAVTTTARPPPPARLVLLPPCSIQACKPYHPASLASGARSVRSSHAAW
jgi:hypothetical protein